MAGHQADIGWQFKANPSSMMEALEMAKSTKEEGNKCFKAGKYGKAVAYYKTGLSKLRSGRNRKFPINNLADELDALEVSLNVNTAMCLVKTEEWEDAITAAGQALRKDPQNAKALLFRARGLIASKHRADGKSRAHSDLSAALALNPKDKAIAAELAKLNKLMGNGDTTIDTTHAPQKISNFKDNNIDDNEEEIILKKNLRNASKPLLSDERSTKPKDKPIATETFKTREEYEQHMAWEAEMIRRKQEADRESLMLAKKKAEEDLEDEALMNGTAKVSGYKLNAEGNKVPIWAKDQVVLPTAVPRRVEVEEVGDENKVNFNRGYQERDMTQWCVNELLGWVLSPLAFKLPDCRGTLRTLPVKDLKGEALMVGVKGKFDHTFDFSFSVEWEAKIGEPKMAEVEVKGKKQQMFLGIPTFHGKLRIPDMGHLQSSEDYDIELSWGGDGPREVSPDATTRSHILDLLKGDNGVMDILRRRMGTFASYYISQQDPQAALESLHIPCEEGKKLLELERAATLSGDWLWADMNELEELPADESKNKALKEHLTDSESTKEDANFDPLKAPKMLNYMDKLQKDGYAVFLGDGKDKSTEDQNDTKSFADTMKSKVNELLSKSVANPKEISGQVAEEQAMLEAADSCKKKTKKKKKKKSSSIHEDSLNYAKFENIALDEEEEDELMKAAEHYEELQQNPLWATILKIAGGDGEKALELMKDPEALQSRPEIAALFPQDESP